MEVLFPLSLAFLGLATGVHGQGTCGNGPTTYTTKSGCCSYEGNFGSKLPDALKLKFFNNMDKSSSCEAACETEEGGFACTGFWFNKKSNSDNQCTLYTGPASASFTGDRGSDRGHQCYPDLCKIRNVCTPAMDCSAEPAVFASEQGCCRDESGDRPTPYSQFSPNKASECSRVCEESNRCTGYWWNHKSIQEDVCYLYDEDTTSWMAVETAAENNNCDESSDSVGLLLLAALIIILVAKKRGWLAGAAHTLMGTAGRAADNPLYAQGGGTTVGGQKTVRLDANAVYASAAAAGGNYLSVVAAADAEKMHTVSGDGANNVLYSIPMESMDASPQGAGNVDSRPFGAVANATYGLESGV
eukprot:gene14934-9027_t